MLYAFAVPADTHIIHRRPSFAFTRDVAQRLHHFIPSLSRGELPAADAFVCGHCHTRVRSINTALGLSHAFLGGISPHPLPNMAVPLRYAAAGNQHASLNGRARLPAYLTLALTTRITTIAAMTKA